MRSVQNKFEYTHTHTNLAAADARGDECGRVHTVQCLSRNVQRRATHRLREKLLSAAVKLPPSAMCIAPPLQPGQPLPVLLNTVLCYVMQHKVQCRLME
eukprot:12355-Heterococcus_DN1.PRE.1